jgi:pimeloyl-ACP methyl ester carboxylesterase
MNRPGLARIRTAAAVAAVVALVAGCGDDDDSSGSPEQGTAPTSATTTPSASKQLNRVVKIDGDRGLYVRCTGTGSPTVIMEGGDEDTSDSYAFAEPTVSKLTRACVYDRANLGQSDPAPGPRGLSDLVGDLERLVQVAKIRPPCVLVGTSGGGYISAGYAYAHPRQVAGTAFIEVPAPFRDPPPEIVVATDPSNPENIEKRDYLQVEKDAWAARERIRDIPVTIVTERPRPKR